MTWHSVIPLLLPISSFVPAIIILLLKEEQKVARTTINLIGAVLKIFLVSYVAHGIYNGERYETRFHLVSDLQMVLRVDDLSLLFLALSSLLWLVTTIYAIGYLEGSPFRSRFFCFFSLCVTATMGISLAGNLITFLVFYEMLTLVTYPLIVHLGSEKALRAGRVYLIYTLFGGTLLLMGTAWVYVLAGPVDFVRGGTLAPYVQDHRHALIAMFVLFVIGLGVKSALIPLHGWLPKAMVAPAPVSALLHAVAVVKAGAFGIIRVVYDVYGTSSAQALNVLQPLAYLASFTIIYASVRALYQQELKRRLAFSTISQISYIILGTCIVGPIGTIGALTHLVHQGLMKITLFFCAGNLAEKLKVTRIDQMNGVGWKMPLTMSAFTVGAFGMIGLPPVAGFISKWYLSMGAATAKDYFFVAVLMVSSLLNASYFLPLVHAAWFKKPINENPLFDEQQNSSKWEISPLLLFPTITTAILSLLAGLFAALHYSPLGLAKLITEGFYTP